MTAGEREFVPRQMKGKFGGGKGKGEGGRGNGDNPEDNQPDWSIDLSREWARTFDDFERQENYEPEQLVE